jgi:HAMP domain-containing protein
MKWIPHLRFRYAHKLFISHIVAVFLVSGSVGTFFYVRALDNLMRSLQSRLQNSAALLSHSIDARDLETITGPESIDDPAYREALDHMRRIRRTNPDIAYLYIMRKDADTVSFVIDSDETDAQAMPGDVYEEVVPSMLIGFHEPAVDDALTEDDWGVFLSGYAPLVNGEGRYLVGIDMRADEVKNKLRELQLTGLASLLAAILLALLFALSLARGLTRRIETLSAHCREVSRGRLDVRIEGRTFDEFDDLAGAFNHMGEALGETRTNLEAAVTDLKAARDELQTRVEERTRELDKKNRRLELMSGLLPICSSCKKIRDDQGYWKQVEHFVAEHSDARFTHGICPDCMVRVYGHLLEEDEKS